MSRITLLCLGAMLTTTALAANVQIPVPQAPTSTQATQNTIPAVNLQPAKPALSDTQKLSYTLGVEIGQNFKDQGIVIEPQMVFKGMEDALTNQKYLMSKEDIHQTEMMFQKQVLQKRAQDYQKLAEVNLKAGTRFLAENAKAAGVQTLLSGLQYKVIAQGSGPKPTASDVVTVDYSGQFIDGTVFDSSYQRGTPTTFPVSQVISGWQQALKLMPVGSTWEVYVPYQLAYGAEGMGNMIGPNETLMFRIHLISIKSAG